MPEASADPVEKQDSEPVIVSVDAAGQLFLNLGQEKQILSLATIKDRVAAVIAPQSRQAGADLGRPGGTLR